MHFHLLLYESSNFTTFRITLYKAGKSRRKLAGFAVLVSVAFKKLVCFLSAVLLDFFFATFPLKYTGLKTDTTNTFRISIQIRYTLSIWKVRLLSGFQTLWSSLMNGFVSYILEMSKVKVCLVASIFFAPLDILLERPKGCFRFFPKRVLLCQSKDTLCATTTVTALTELFLSITITLAFPCHLI